MTRLIAIAISVASALTCGVAVVLVVARALWSVETARGNARLRSRAGANAPYSSDELAGLPPPVARYFAFALTPGQPMVTNASFRQLGEFAMRPDSWCRFTASEYFSVDPPGFLWSATIRMATAMNVLLHDGYAAGEGAMVGKLAGLFSVVDQRGTPQMATGELLRYLAEAVLLPTALLPRAGLSWTPIDERNARATLVDRDSTVSCDMQFGESGEISRISALRFRDVNGTPVLTEWNDDPDRGRRPLGLAGRAASVLARYITAAHHDFASPRPARPPCPPGRGPA